MKKIIITNVILLAVLLMSFKAKEYKIKEKHIIGTWEYSVPDAPYEYKKGEFTFIKESMDFI